MANIKAIIGEELFKQLSPEKQKELEKQDLEDVSEGKYIPKDRFNSVNEEAKEYKKKIAERDKQLTDLQDKVKDNETLKSDLATLTAQNKKDSDEYEAKLKKVAFDYAIDNAIKGSNAKDAKLIRALLDESKIKIDGETILGLNDQLDSIKKEREYLFDIKPAGTGGFKPGGTGGGRTEDSFASKLGKQKAEQMKQKGIEEFIK